MESVDTMVMVREGKGVAIKQHPLDKYDIMVEEEKVKKKKKDTQRHCAGMWGQIEMLLTDRGR